MSIVVELYISTHVYSIDRGGADGGEFRDFSIASRNLAGCRSICTAFLIPIQFRFSSFRNPRDSTHVKRWFSRMRIFIFTKVFNKKGINVGSSRARKHIFSWLKRTYCINLVKLHIACLYIYIFFFSLKCTFIIGKYRKKMLSLFFIR